MFTDIYYIHHICSFNFMIPHKLQIFLSHFVKKLNITCNETKKPVYTNDQAVRHLRISVSDLSCILSIWSCNQ